MPPRRSARLVELANPHFQLPFPPNVVALLFSLLPVDARLRAREACRGWRFFLDDASFWTHVDLSEGSGVNPRFLTSERLALALLPAACLRAKGKLLSVDLSGVKKPAEEEREDSPVLFVLQCLDSASAADKASLRDLVAPHYPILDVEQNPGTEQAVLDLAFALSVYKGMEKLTLSNMRLETRAAVDALVDAAISAGSSMVQWLWFNGCGLSHTALPALTRLLESPGFEHLIIWNGDVTLLEGPSLPAFCEALRGCKSLKELELDRVNLWVDTTSASQLIAALEGQQSLQELHLWYNRTDVTPAVQRAAGEFVARLVVRSTSLRYLDLSYNRLGMAGLTPFFEALRSSSKLAELNLGGEPISADFARDVVLPAVRENTRLRKLVGLSTVDLGGEDPSLREVEHIDLGLGGSQTGRRGRCLTLV